MGNRLAHSRGVFGLQLGTQLGLSPYGEGSDPSFSERVVSAPVSARRRTPPSSGTVCLTVSQAGLGKSPRRRARRAAGRPAHRAACEHCRHQYASRGSRSGCAAEAYSPPTFWFSREISDLFFSCPDRFRRSGRFSTVGQQLGNRLAHSRGILGLQLGNSWAQSLERVDPMRSERVSAAQTRGLRPLRVEY